MLVEIAKCPHCGAGFNLGASSCIYCGSALVYKSDKEEIKKDNVGRHQYVTKDGILIRSKPKIRYYGCPICFKRSFKNNSWRKHGEEAVLLSWKECVVRDLNGKDFVVLCSPGVKELFLEKRYRFYGSIYSGKDEILVYRVEELKN